MSWIETTFWWYLVLLVLGLIFTPLTKKIFGKYFFDSGFPFAKTIGILFLSYAVFLAGVVKILSFNIPSMIFLLTIFLGLNLYLIRREIPNILSAPILGNKKILIFIAYEVVFFLSLISWVYVRGQEPSIRGLEKFMDFGFINSILRSHYFPPPDMWLSGHSINYYYFGHLTAAVLTKLSGIPSYNSYNLILATIFALSITQTFSLASNLIYKGLQKNIKLAFLAGVLGTFLVNFAGNLHTIYLFTKGYPNDKPIPFWQIFSKFTPEKYWYPNATRFIPFTIHEFPIYSYVVADLHGHVFDIPFVLLTLAVLLIIFLKYTKKNNSTRGNTNIKIQMPKIFHPYLIELEFKITKKQLLIAIFLGFLTAVHYMTNAFDGPIYMLLSIFILFALLGLTRNFFTNVFALIGSFIIFTLPFSLNFSPFVSGIGVNCAPQFLTSIKKFGPFLFESGNCQSSPLWMLWVLWGFFWINFIFLIVKILLAKKRGQIENLGSPSIFILILFLFSTILLLIPEFFYIKDIYPGHFRANTMFKLGYQAFMMMALASSFVFILFKTTLKKNIFLSAVYFLIFFFIFSLVAVYPYFATTSYYGKLDKSPSLDGSVWINSTYSEYKEIIDFLNTNVKDQPTILEAQGDSYTDFNVVSAYTGLPTVAGWFVHQWLWRGSPSFVSDRVPDIQNIYESEDIESVKNSLKKYSIKYIIVGTNERQRYANLKEDKFRFLGKIIFTSQNHTGKIFKVNTP